MKAYIVYVKGKGYENVEAFLSRVDAEDYACRERINGATVWLEEHESNGTALAAAFKSNQSS